VSTSAPAGSQVEGGFFQALTCVGSTLCLAAFRGKTILDRFLFRFTLNRPVTAQRLKRNLRLEIVGELSSLPSHPWYPLLVRGIP